MNESATKKTKAVTTFTSAALPELRKELNQAHKEAGSDVTIARRVAFLELGLGWTEIEARSHGFLNDPQLRTKQQQRKLSTNDTN